MDATQFAGRVVLVTGSSSGIGLAIAKRFAALQANVVVTGRDPERLQAAAREIAPSGGGSLLPICVDVGSAESVTDAFAAAIQQYGSIDILVNNAGHRSRSMFWEMPVEEWDAVVGSILRGTFLCSRAVVRTWISAGRQGVIVNVGSIGAERGLVSQSHYAAAKGGVRMLTKTMALELAPHGIRVNSVDPGAIATPMIADRLSDPADLEFYANRIPVGRVGNPEEVAAAVQFLVSDEASYITGTSLAVDGGWLAG